MIIAHNISSANAWRYTNGSNKLLSKTSERLSTGYKINRASDNAAGLKISEKMRSQILGLQKASDNIQDGISFIQTADGGLGDMQSLIQRGRELSVQAANDTNVDADREQIQNELDEVIHEITRISDQTEFNKIKCFPPGGTSPNTIKTDGINKYNIQIDTLSASATVTSAFLGTNPLADKIATELIPNAVDQILKAFPVFDTGESIKNLSLQIGNIDGTSGTLAYAQISYYSSNGQINSFTLKVDSSDFTNDDANGTGSHAEMLESTIAHEMMHHVMYNALTDGMTAYGPDTFPTWFVEGSAQLAGGGFTTGWNNTLTFIENSSQDSATKDINVTNYLKTYTPSGRPYGHGYLATAYLGYLASGDSTISAQSISTGINKIFSSIKNDGMSLNDAIAANTAFSGTAAVEAAFSNPNASLVSFTRTLAAANGAGSVIADSLSTNGTDILNSSTSGLKSLFVVSETLAPLNPDGGSVVLLNGLNLQVGANSNQSIGLSLYDMSVGNLGLSNIMVSDHISSGNAIESFDGALEKVSKVRSYYGAIQNRLEHAIANSDNTAENLQAAESRLRDADMAKEMVNYSKVNILLQAGQAMIAQANNSRDGVINLFN
jgi:flagellin-like hook-associated protein FlgL